MVLFIIANAFSVPYEWNSLIKYMPTFLIQMFTIYYTSQICISIALLFYVFCKFFVGFVNDIERCLSDFNDEIARARNLDGIIELNSQQKAVLDQQLGDIVEFHANARQLITCH